MSEKEYIKVTNRTRITIALEIMGHVLPDDENIETVELQQVIQTLGRWQAYLFEEDEITEDEA